MKTYGKEYWLFYIIPLLLCVSLGFGIGYFTSFSEGFRKGLEIQKQKDLELCKKAGWDFIEEKIFPKRNIKTGLFGQEYAKKQLMHLQSNIATKCIVNIK